MNNIKHLLSQNGILTSFNICKKVSPTKINNIKKKLLKTGIPEDKIENELYKHIISKHIDDSTIEDIPGIILDGVPPKIKIKPTVQKKIASTSSEISEYFKKNKFTKEEIILYIQAVFFLCGITNDDVSEFKEKYNINNDNDEDYLDEEDDDDDDDEESGFE
jgi:hypothetical protein